MNTYTSGSLVRTIATFTDVNNNLVNPTTVVVKYRAGSGSTQTPSPVNDSAGVWHYDIDTTGWAGPSVEIYTVQWQGTGSVQAIAVDQFQVGPAAL